MQKGLRGEYVGAPLVGMGDVVSREGMISIRELIEGERLNCCKLQYILVFFGLLSRVIISWMLVLHNSLLIYERRVILWDSSLVRVALTVTGRHSDGVAWLRWASWLKRRGARQGGFDFPCSYLLMESYQFH